MNLKINFHTIEIPTNGADEAILTEGEAILLAMDILDGVIGQSRQSRFPVEFNPKKKAERKAEEKAPMVRSWPALENLLSARQFNISLAIRMQKPSREVEELFCISRATLAKEKAAIRRKLGLRKNWEIARFVFDLPSPPPSKYLPELCGGNQ